MTQEGVERFTVDGSFRVILYCLREIVREFLLIDYVLVFGCDRRR